MAGRKKRTWEEWIEPKLDDIEAWAREGLSIKEIHTRLGMSSAVFYGIIKTHPEFYDVYHRGAAHAIPKVEAALYKLAVGFEYEEETEELNIATGELQLVKRVKKYKEPSITAIMNILKNKKSGEWSDVTKVDLTGKIDGPALCPTEKTAEIARLLLEGDLGNDKDK